MTALTQSAFARHLGVDRAHVSRLKKTGRLVMTPDGERVLVAESEARIAATADPGKVAVAERHAAKRAGQAAAVDGQKVAKTEVEMSPEAVAEKTAMTYQQARAVKERYNALQAKADYEKFTGKLVEYDLARSAGAELGILFRTALERWPDTVAPMLVNLNDREIRIILIDQVENILVEIVERMKTMLPDLNQ